MLQNLPLLKLFFTKFKKTHNYFLLWQYFLIIFMRQTLTDDFLVLRKNRNCAFPLKDIMQNSRFTSSKPNIF